MSNITSRNWDTSQEQINLSTIIPTIDSQEEFQSDESLSLKDLKMGQIQKQVKTKLNILGDHSPQQHILPTSFSTKEDRPSTQRVIPTEIPFSSRIGINMTSNNAKPKKKSE